MTVPAVQRSIPEGISNPEAAGITVSIVVAMAEGDVIGNGGQLPWHIPDELRRFRKLTLRKPVVMGRRTWESLPRRPLPERPNIVLSRNAAFCANGAIVEPNLKAALTRARKDGHTEAMAIGGHSVFEEALTLATRIHMTLVHARFDGDVRFPKFDRDIWCETHREDHQPQAGNPAWSAVILERITPGA